MRYKSLHASYMDRPSRVPDHQTVTPDHVHYARRVWLDERPTVLAPLYLPQVLSHPIDFPSVAKVDELH